MRAIEAQYTGYNALDKNAYVEREIRTIKEKEIWPSARETFGESHQVKFEPMWNSITSTASMPPWVIGRKTNLQPQIRNLVFAVFGTLTLDSSPRLGRGMNT